MTSSPKTPTQAPFILLAAGGTGGHVFPAEALAAALEARGCRLGLVTDTRGAVHGGALGRLETWRVAAGGLAGIGLKGRATGVLRLARGMVQAWRLVGRLKPDGVVGFGGYASVPAVLAATLRRTPSLIHEQNAVLGRANRLLAPRVTGIATALPEVRFLPDGRGQHVGNPVRAAFLERRDAAYAAPEPAGPIHILVTGGSQGARALTDLVPEAMNRLPAPVRARLRITQQCRPEDLERARATYAAAGIMAETAAFLDDMPARLSGTHLVIARAGASTVAELTCVGRPAVLIPLPGAIDDHQTANARALSDAGAAWLMPQAELTAERLAARLEPILSDGAGLSAAAAQAHALGRPDAAERLADLTLSLTTPNAGRAAA
ncbi:undecaprenyldiphospho-muramoylpentapeptide beta-N-acetylglucosaminyltransferase [Roseospira marina]|uniref:UDP-N-acetylglucosamine--N-acetylmuramyl-(pentapeptide) pyrophosphoryl-undecaprenol N-acetylglucosamine transferase n=2 Tax=Roseospira marina TaxID=140057 RepID=A0A5M6I8N2_9PROT|nr:undecaprenyldiphospho-muramoylpentapeptide beta-N-acetylglucosaminyltransferase [Roseospira marina]